MMSSKTETRVELYPKLGYLKVGSALETGRDLDAFVGVFLGVLLSLPLWAIIGAIAFALI